MQHTRTDTIRPICQQVPPKKPSDTPVYPPTSLCVCLSSNHPLCVSMPCIRGPCSTPAKNIIKQALRYPCLSANGPLCVSASCMRGQCSTPLHQTVVHNIRVQHTLTSDSCIHMQLSSLCIHISATYTCNYLPCAYTSQSPPWR